MVNKLLKKLGMVLVALGCLGLQPDIRTTGFKAEFLAVKNWVSPAVPAQLSERDREAYKALFAAQERGDWKAADEAARSIQNPILLGHAQAERYQNHRYKPTNAELTSWLEQYSDHPQAYDLYILAAGKSPAAVKNIEPVKKPAMLSGYGDSHANATRFTAAGHTLAWHSGMEAWRSGKKATAAKLFSRLADNKKLTSWQASAAAYWAHRAFDATGDKQKAYAYLRRAAEEGRSFYGILARKQLGLPLEAVGRAPDAIETHDAADPVVRRTIALTEIGQTELAERELRIAFPKAAAEGKTKLLALAHALKLASVQISMARQMEQDGQPLDFALYPVPHWQPQDGFKIDPALIYALTRQESGFRASATSPAGASGLMQLMPATASMMKKHLSVARDSNANEPEINMMLGQNYVRHLLEHQTVNGNMVYMLIAYNAGAARLIEWKDRIDTADPLFFVENIPYAETRAYVMQVMANYWMYAEISGQPNNPTAVAMARGQWPAYNATTPVAALAWVNSKS